MQSAPLSQNNAEDCPKGVRDIVFIFETPHGKAASEVEDLKKLYITLHKNDTASLRCMHYGMVVADNDIEIIQTLDCQSKRCFDNSLNSLERVSQNLKGTTRE